MTDGETHVGTEDIAVVGMSGRFPMAENVDAFWRNLREGRECISTFTDEELIESGVAPELLADPNYVRSWGWMDGVDRFDPGFFDITPREAEITDPQIRLLLECAWESLEDAGYDPSRYPGRIGVYAGSTMMFYLWQNLVPTPGLIDSVGFVQAWIVNDRDFVATRVNYKLDLKGPGMTVQTACSTSLVSIHLGIQSLLSGESDMVLAGGVCAPLPDKAGYLYTEGGTLSPDGKVRTFDARGKGMLGGNGVALVVLKRLEDALADGDHVRAVIKGTALNNDGVDKVTYTAPSVDGQVQVILDTLDVAGVDPRSISYVEAHGTGTPLGDPIEIAALTQAWRARIAEASEGGTEPAPGWCPIGSVKTNIGHLDTAAGVAGVVKTILALEHKEIPPSLNYEEPNPQIDFETSPFRVNTELRPWTTEHLPRRAAVSSLGMGGTNAHAILEEAPELPSGESARKHQLLLLSARSEAALGKAGERLHDHLAGEGAGASQPLADVAFTTQVGRKAFLHRRAVVARDHADALDALATLDKKRTQVGASMLTDRPVAFLFSGQGAQYANMMRGLYQGEARFREELDRCCELLTPILGHDLRTMLFPAPDDAGAEEAANEALKRTENTQPALFVVEYALARLLESFGVEPAAMLGHSIGEYVAACLAEVFSLEDALALVAARGRLIGGLPAGGGMLAVELSEASLAPLLKNGLALAAINAPELCVVSGPLEEIERLERGLQGRGVSTRPLVTSHGFHSPLMDPILAEFEAEVRRVTLAAPTRTVISCTTGRELTAAEATDPAYWVKHLRQPVRFADAVEGLVAEDRVLLEVGPGQTLTSLARLTLLERPQVSVIATTRHPKDASDDEATLLGALGALWIAGAAIDWHGFHGEDQRRRVPLPTYPWEHRRYWVERPAPEAVAAGASASAATRKEPDLARWFYTPTWRQAPLPRGANDVAEGPWLLIADEGGLGDALAATLRDAGATVSVARRAEAFAANAGGNGAADYAFDARDPDGLLPVLEALEAAQRAPARIVHTLATGSSGAADEDRPLEEASFFGPMFLGRALAKRPPSAPVRVAVVTEEAQDVLHGRPACPERALALGPVKSLTLELPDVVGTWIDVEGEPDAALCDAIVAELLRDTAAGHEPMVALHGGQRWVRGHEPVLLGERSAGVPAHLEPGGTYLVTGGLGGIGLVFAELLADTVQARLVLTARSELPAREAWDDWIAEHGEEDGTSRRIASVRRLEELGSEVLVAAADVADEAAMGAVVDAAVERFGKVHGVIHCAGVLGTGVLETKPREEAERVLAPKVRGTQVLEAVFRGREPELFVLTSSISSAPRVLSGFDYASANAFLDAWAHHRQGRRDEAGTHYVAIGWDTWSEVGMATQGEVPAHMKERHERSLALAVSPAEGREAFLRALDAGLTQVYVSGLDLVQRDDVRAREEALAPADESAPAAAPSAARTAHPRPELSTAYVAPEGEVQTAICGIWADLLGLEKVGVRDNLFELGGNSLIMMQLGVRLRSLYGVSLPISELFDLPEVAQLAERIESIQAVASVDIDDESSEEIEEFTL